jgi:hypothetical protein
MTENTVVILLYMLMATAFGVLIGRACQDQICRRQHAEERVEELTDQFADLRSGTSISHRQFKELRGVLNNAHKHILAVSKAFQKAPRQVPQNQWPDRRDSAAP